FAPLPCLLIFPFFSFFFFFRSTSLSEFYTLSLHDALPIWIFFLFRFNRLPLLIGQHIAHLIERSRALEQCAAIHGDELAVDEFRSEEHTSELQSRENLVCRLLLEKKKCTCQPRSHRDVHAR